MRGSIQHLHNLLSRSKRRATIRIALLALSTVVHALGQTVSASSPTLAFTGARVGIPSGSAETLTETFQLTGYTTLLAPTAALHYGLAYTAGTLNCTGILGSQTCTISVTFQPNYPGGRRDALFLMSGTTRLATVLLYGVGQSPFALIQPGIVTTTIPSAANYVYGSVVDENGTTYVLLTGANSVLARTSAGVFTTLPITGLNSPRTIAIDGAGVLYIADQKPHGPITTYDTVQHLQGSTPFPTGPFYVQALTTGNTGSLYETDGVSIYTVAPGGSTTTTLLNPAITQLEIMAVDSSENLFLGGYTINELTSGGTQSVVNTVGAQSGLSLDAADTLYATRYTGSGGVVELPSYSYSTNIAALDPASSPLGSSLAPDGTLYVSNYINFDKVDRSQGAITFKAINSGQSDTETTTLYNGGNLPLTVASVALTGDPDYTLTAPTTGTCIANLVLSPGTLCSVSIHLTAPHAGLFTGTLTITTNSLANPSATNTVALSDQVDGAYITTSPSALDFGNQNVGTQSASQTITFTNSGLINSASLSSPISSNPVFQASIGTCGPALATGSTCTMTVTFSPTAAQAYTATLTIFPGNGQTLTLPLTGTGTSAAPTATLTPATLSFPSTTTGTTSAALSTTLSNTGTAVLNISGITLTGANPTDFAETTNCGATLAANATCSISVTFTPASAATFTATVSVADNATGSPQTATLTGTGTPAPAPIAALSPSALSFPSTAVGSTTTPQTLTLSNTGNAPLNISAITIAGANPTNFAQTSTCGKTLAANATCTISLTFTPASAATFTAAVSVADNATNSPQTSTLNGTGTPAPAPIATLSPSTLTFPSTTVGSTTTPQTLTLSNTGNAPLNISAITIAGANPTNFAQTSTCGKTLAANAICTISLAFTPSSATTFTAAVSVADNATNSPQTSTLNGTGTPAPAPIATLSPSTLTFPSTTVGTTTAAQTLTLSNTGNAVLNISGISLGGTNPTNFAKTTTCNETLATNSSCTISVTFTPSSIAAFTATVSIADNAAGSPQTATLTGSGTAAPDFTLTASPQSQTVTGGTPATYNIAAGSLNGTFSNAITLSATGVPTGATATFLPATLTPGSDSPSSVLTLQTTTALARLRTHSPWLPVSAMAFCIPLFWWRKRNRQRLLSTGLLCLLLSIAATTLSACGGGYYAHPPSQTYSITVTGTSGSTQHSTTVTLTVQ